MRIQHLALGAVAVDVFQWLIRQWLLGEGELLLMALIRWVVAEGDSQRI